MKLTWIVFFVTCTMNIFASEVQDISIKVGDNSLESFANLLVTGMKKDCANVNSVMHQYTGIFYFSQPIIIETKSSAYRVDSFQAEAVELSDDTGRFMGYSFLNDKTRLVTNLKLAREHMMHGKNSGTVLQTKPNTIELHHPTGRIILFLLPTTGTTDATKLGYNPQSDARLLDF